MIDLFYIVVRDDVRDERRRGILIIISVRLNLVK